MHDKQTASVVHSQLGNISFRLLTLIGDYLFIYLFILHLQDVLFFIFDFNYILFSTRSKDNLENFLS